MRSPLLGVCFGHDRAKLREMVRASTLMTHRDPRAEQGALAVALAAHHSASDAAPDSPRRAELLEMYKGVVDKVADVGSAAMASDAAAAFFRPSAGGGGASGAGAGGDDKKGDLASVAAALLIIGNVAIYKMVNFRF